VEFALANHHPVRLPRKGFPSVELRSQLLLLHLGIAEEKGGRFGVAEAKHFGALAAEDGDRNARAVPAEELAAYDCCGNPSAFEVGPDLLRQETVIPLRDVSRGEYGFEHARNGKRALQTARDGKCTALVYLYRLALYERLFYAF